MIYVLFPVLTALFVTFLAATLFLAFYRWTLAVGLFAAAGLCLTLAIGLEAKLIVPVEGATAADWHPETFWYEPWGSSIVHRGIDIFAEHGADIIAPTGLVIIKTGEAGKSGKYAVGLDRSLRLHYFAHMDSILVDGFDLVSTGMPIGSVGDTGNAKGKPPHLHYGLASVIPRPWNMTDQKLGHLRAFYMNPIEQFELGQAAPA